MFLATKNSWRPRANLDYAINCDRYCADLCGRAKHLEERDLSVEILTPIDLPGAWAALAIGVIDSDKLRKEVLVMTERVLSNDQETLCLVVLLDALEEHESVLNVWKTLSSPMRLQVMNEVIERRPAYIPFLKTMSHAIDRSEVLWKRFSDDASYSLTFGEHFDRMVVNILLRRVDWERVDLSIIGDRDLRDLGHRIVQRFGEQRSSEIWRTPSISMNLDVIRQSLLVENMSQAEQFLESLIEGNTESIATVVNVLSSEFPNVADSTLERFSSSTRVSERAIVLDIIQSQSKDETMVEHLFSNVFSAHFRSTPANELSYIQNWACTSAAIDLHELASIRKSVWPLLEKESQNAMQNLVDKINAECLDTFFCTTFADALRSKHKSMKKTKE